MSILDTIKTVTALAKATANLELQEKVAELREQVVDLKEENTRLKEESLDLRQQLERFTKGDPCPKCKQPTWALESSRPHPMMGEIGVIERTYKCSACGHSENRVDSGVERGR